MNKKLLIILGYALSICFLTAAAVTYVIDSNTQQVTWSLNCSSGSVCVFLGTLSGNTTLVNYSVKILSMKSLVSQYINTTLAAGPPNVAYNLNGTTGTHWLFGPYSFQPNIYYNYAFVLKYNGTAGSYDFAVNVLQG